MSTTRTPTLESMGERLATLKKTAKLTPQAVSGFLRKRGFIAAVNDYRRGQHRGGVKVVSLHRLGFPYQVSVEYWDAGSKLTGEAYIEHYEVEMEKIRAALQEGPFVFVRECRGAPFRVAAKP